MKKVFVWVAAVLAVGMFQFAGIMPVAADNSEVVIASDQKPADAAAPAAPAEEAPAPAQGEEVQPPPEEAPAQGEEVQPPPEEAPAPEEGQEIKGSGSQG